MWHIDQHCAIKITLEEYQKDKYKDKDKKKDKDNGFGPKKPAVDPDDPVACK